MADAALGAQAPQLAGESQHLRDCRREKTPYHQWTPHLVLVAPPPKWGPAALVDLFGVGVLALTVAVVVPFPVVSHDLDAEGVLRSLAVVVSGQRALPSWELVLSALPQGTYSLAQLSATPPLPPFPLTKGASLGHRFRFRKVRIRLKKTSNYPCEEPVTSENQPASVQIGIQNRKARAR